jgi:hypothetical protein
MKKYLLLIFICLAFSEIANAQKTNLELLQGKWQSIDDKTNFLIFENNHRKEANIIKGKGDWDDEEFVLSDKCLNDSDKDIELDKEKDKYISCLESDLCWYIVSIDEKTLSLSYMGRGNTLTYKKVKSKKTQPLIKKTN